MYFDRVNDALSNYIEKKKYSVVKKFLRFFQKFYFYF